MTPAPTIDITGLVAELRGRSAYPGDVNDQAAALIESLRESLHYANGVADLAIKHRVAAEARGTTLEAEKAQAIRALDLALDSDRQSDIREAIAIRATLFRSSTEVKNDER